MKKLKIVLTFALVTAMPSSAFANGRGQPELCRMDFHSGMGFMFIPCLAGVLWH